MESRVATRRTTLVATLVAGLAALASAPAYAQAVMTPDGFEVIEMVGDGDGAVDPGETIAITQWILSDSTSDLTDVAGHLSVSGVETVAAVEQATASWPLVAFDMPTPSSAPFVVVVGATHPCGVPLELSLALHTSAGDVTMPVRIPTGSVSSSQLLSTTNMRVPIPDGGGFAEQTITMATAGVVRSARVRSTSLRHPASGDLRLTLIAPDGRRVVLADQRGGSSADAYMGTVFSDGASTPIALAMAPFTQVRPEQPLAGLDGAPATGTWRFRVEDLRNGGRGTLESWTIATPIATCGGEPSVTTDPSHPGRRVGATRYRQAGRGVAHGLDGSQPGRG